MSDISPRPQLTPFAPEGHESDPLVLLEGSTPDVICMPGETLINMKTQMRWDIIISIIINIINIIITIIIPITKECRSH